MREKRSKTAKNSAKRDWRLTQQRMVILDFIRQNKTHPTAERIYQGVRQQLKKISFGTIYRNLNFLRSHGYIKEFIVNKISRFDERVDSHVHLICDGCQHITDLSEDSLANELKSISRKQNFFIRYENLELHGYCPDCQKELSPKKQTPELFCLACGELLEDLKKEVPVCRDCCFQTNCHYYGPAPVKK